MQRTSSWPRNWPVRSWPSTTNSPRPLLSLVGDSSASEPLRCRAALSLGPVLEQMDQGRDDHYLSLDEETFEPPPISEHTFQRIKETLRVRYLEDDLPPEVRRHVLEASVRAPADWHRDAIRDAYSREDRDWRLTAVLAMRHVRGFGDEIVAALPTIPMPRFGALRWPPPAIGRWMARGRTCPPCWPRRTPTRHSCSPPSKRGAFIRPQEAEPLLVELSDSDDAEIADAAGNAAMMAAAAVEDEFDDDPEL